MNSESHPNWPETAALLTALPPDNQAGGGGAYVDLHLVENWGIAPIALTAALKPNEPLATSIQSLSRIPLQISQSKWLMVQVAMRIVFRGEPYPVAKLRHFSRPWREACVHLKDLGLPVVASSLPSLILAREAGVPLLAYVAHNCEWKIAKSHPSRLIRMFWRRTLRWERRLIGNTPVWAVSRVDARALAAVIEGPTHSLNFVGRDFTKAHARPKKKSDLLTIGYIGSYSWAPNARDVATILNHVIPKLAAEGVRAELLLAGRNTDAVVHPSATVLGEINDVTSFYDSIDVVVVPRPATATGVSVKVLEALAHGIPVVTTTSVVDAIGTSPQMYACKDMTEIVHTLRLL